MATASLLLKFHTIGANLRSIFAPRRGFLFKRNTTLSAAPETDTDCHRRVVTGVLRADVTDKISTWILTVFNDTRRIGAVGTGSKHWPQPVCSMGAKSQRIGASRRELRGQFPRLKIDPESPSFEMALINDNGPQWSVNLSLAMIQEDYGPYVAQSVEQELALRLTKEDQDELPPEGDASENHPIDRFSRACRLGYEES